MNDLICEKNIFIYLLFNCTSAQNNYDQRIQSDLYSFGKSIRNARHNLSTIVIIELVKRRDSACKMQSS
ncbi:unnamed protein product [Adineta ricciae]|uniref:Uncharacterized protein n=1 Tax=Adineta ricciae TaxID=249248 RepID=A0A815IBA2_ADIRI|nr:unnamed protein product [Adineta ricciae]